MGEYFKNVYAVPAKYLLTEFTKDNLSEQNVNDAIVAFKGFCFRQ